MNQKDYEAIAGIIKENMIKLSITKDVIRVEVINDLADYFGKEESSPIKEPPTDDCQECGGDGVLLSLNTDRNHLEIQRCDNCCRFDGDLEAWEYVRPIFKKKIFNQKQFLKNCGMKE